MGSENVEFLRELYGRWGKGDFDTAAMFGEEFKVILGPDFPDAGVHAGREAVAAYMKGFLEPWEQITIKAEQLTEDGDQVLAKVLQAGVGIGSGAGVDFRYFQLWTFEDGRPLSMETIRHEPETRARLAE